MILRLFLLFPDLSPVFLIKRILIHTWHQQASWASFSDCIYLAYLDTCKEPPSQLCLFRVCLERLIYKKKQTFPHIPSILLRLVSSMVADNNMKGHLYAARKYFHVWEQYGLISHQPLCGSATCINIYVLFQTWSSQSGRTSFTDTIKAEACSWPGFDPGEITWHSSRAI